MIYAKNLLLAQTSMEIKQNHDPYVGPSGMLYAGIQRNQINIDVRFIAESSEDTRDFQAAHMSHDRVAIVSMDELDAVQKQMKTLEELKKEALCNVHETGVMIVAENEALLKRVGELEAQLENVAWQGTSSISTKVTNTKK